MSAQIVSVKYNENNVPYIGIGDHEIRLESEQPKEAAMEKARTELRELPEITGPAITELREMLKGKHGLKTRHTNWFFFSESMELIEILWNNKKIVGNIRFQIDGWMMSNVIETRSIKATYLYVIAAPSALWYHDKYGQVTHSNWWINGRYVWTPTLKSRVKTKIMLNFTSYVCLARGVRYGVVNNDTHTGS